MARLNFPWQDPAWHQLQTLTPRLPHAILFHGAQGIGKTVFAQNFAQALLCEQPDGTGHACGNCTSCIWFSQSNHPDYRCVRPEVLDGASAESDEEGNEKVKKGTTRQPSKEIRIDQIRALADFMNISTHRNGVRVVLLYPAEALNAAAANAILKTLEEPPPATVFLLVSSNPDRLLPTIRSRCRRFTLATPTVASAIEWLRQQGVADAEIWLAEQGGAPLAAQSAAASEDHQLLQDFLQQLTHPNDVTGALKIAEQLQKTPLIEPVAWLQRWLYDLLALKLAGRVRYYPRYQTQLQALAAQSNSVSLAQALSRLSGRNATARHPLSPKLFLEDMLLDYSTIFF